MEFTYVVENLAIKDDFTNRFAQQVYKLEDGTSIYIDYDRKNVTIERPKYSIDQDKLNEFMKSIPTTK